MSRLTRKIRGWWHHRGLDEGGSPVPIPTPPQPSPAEPERFYYKPHVQWWLDRKWLEPFEACISADATASQPATRILDRRFTLVKFAESIRSLEGSTAECGVFRGVGSALICQALSGTYTGDHTHWGFDSFEGLPEPEACDRAEQSQYDWWKKGSLAVSEADTRKYLAPYHPCRIERGWIPACLEPARGDRFRFLHIDVDLAKPTTDCLEFFYSRLVPGAVILFDDYGFASCPGARVAVDEFFRDKSEHVIELATGQAFVIKKR
ncbi:MAG: TylF/MycF/NovP-related O-methyltransferase [Planctomycetota bacterium]|jgi:hypothetical protein